MNKALYPQSFPVPPTSSLKETKCVLTFLTFLLCYPTCDSRITKHIHENSYPHCLGCHLFLLRISLRFSIHDPPLRHFVLGSYVGSKNSSQISFWAALTKYKIRFQSREHLWTLTFHVFPIVFTIMLNGVKNLPEVIGFTTLKLIRE